MFIHVLLVHYYNLMFIYFSNSLLFQVIVFAESSLSLHTLRDCGVLSTTISCFVFFSCCRLTYLFSASVLMLPFAAVTHAHQTQKAHGGGSVRYQTAEFCSIIFQDDDLYLIEKRNSIPLWCKTNVTMVDESKHAHSPGLLTELVCCSCRLLNNVTSSVMNCVLLAL